MVELNILISINHTKPLTPELFVVAVAALSAANMDSGSIAASAAVSDGVFDSGSIMPCSYVFFFLPDFLSTAD
jgi:hypothetical protein